MAGQRLRGDRVVFTEYDAIERRCRANKLGNWGSNLCKLSGPAICEASRWGQRPWWGSIWDTARQWWIGCGAGVPTTPHPVVHHVLRWKQQYSGTVGVHTSEGTEKRRHALHGRARGDSSGVWGEVDEVETNHNYHGCSHTKQNLIFWYKQLFLLYLNL